MYDVWGIFIGMSLRTLVDTYKNVKLDGKQVQSRGNQFNLNDFIYVYRSTLHIPMYIIIYIQEICTVLIYLLNAKPAFASAVYKFFFRIERKLYIKAFRRVVLNERQ